MNSEKKTAQKGDELRIWQERFDRDRQEYQQQLDRMDRREKLYRGTADIIRKDGTRGDKATHVRNIVQEIIDTEVDSNIPQPKVTAMYAEDEELAQLIEDMLRNELDRLPMEQLNDMDERTCPIQGGDVFLVDWDITRGTHSTIGEIAVSQIHPKRIVPQHGATDVERMDYFFVTETQSKGYIKRRYGVDVDEETEEEPENRKIDGDSAAEGMVTKKTAFFRNKDGGIGRFSWVNDIVLENLEDCQTRRLHICKQCGEVGDGVVCRLCGSKSFRAEVQEYEELKEDVVRSDGSIIPAQEMETDELGMPVTRMIQPMETDGFMLPQMQTGYGFGVTVQYTNAKIPYYKPDIYPIVVRKNVSLEGEFLGGSDVDAIEYQQNATNKLSTKINRKVLGGGSVLTKPAAMEFDYSDQDMQVLNLSNPQQLQMIQHFSTQIDISPDLNWRAAVYEEARQQIGITDSMQGREDRTATSAVAKQFSAQQAAGRMESKRTMKRAFYADLFRMMFKLKLAYADEPRPVVSHNEQGEKIYRQFSRWDFLKKDAAGQWYWNDRFLFSCDNAAPLAGDREKLWQENRMNLQQGAYGPANELESLIIFWENMDRLHYPMAAFVKKQMQDRLQQQREQAMMAQSMQVVQDTGGVPTAEAAPMTDGGETL